MIAVCAAEDLRVPEDLRADRGTLPYAARRITVSRSFIGVIPPGSSETLRFSAVHTRSLRDHEPRPGLNRARVRAGPEPGQGTGQARPAACRSDRKPRIAGPPLLADGLLGKLKPAILDRRLLRLDRA